MESDNETGYILKIPNNTNYWLLRADGGKYLTDFEQNSFIGIGHNKITIQEINNSASPKDNLGRTDIKFLYEKYYSDEAKQAITLRSNQLESFIYDFKIGDIVIVPNRQSIYYDIGIISGNPYDEPEDNLKFKQRYKTPNGLNYRVCPYIKRRKVCWVKSVKRHSLPKELSFVVNAQQTIFSIREAHNAINKLLSPVFIDSKGINIVIATDIDNGLSIEQLASISPVISDRTSGGKTVRIDLDKNSPTTITTILQNIDYPQTVQALKDIIALLIHLNSPQINTGMTVITIYKLLQIVFGKNITKIGLLQYFANLKSQHLDDQLKELEIQKKKQELNESMKKSSNLSEIDKNFLSMNPKLKIIGSEILHEKDIVSDQQKIAKPKQEMMAKEAAKANTEDQTKKE